MAIRFTARFDKRAADFVAKKLADLEKPVTQADASLIASQSEAEMKKLIASGISPIKGPGIPTRFPRYKNPDNYPGKRKPSSPVNLNLKGDQMADLKARVVSAASGFAVEVGYSDQKQKVKEKGHREGANGQPSRPTIPIGVRGETFASSIQNIYLKVLSSAIGRITRRKL